MPIPSMGDFLLPCLRLLTGEARGYLTKVQHRVVLIGGRELARLMIRHGVGVRDRVAYVIRSVDEDYFADPEG